jgi:hypothetical protein
MVLAAALVVAVVITAMITTGTLHLFGAQATPVSHSAVTPAVLQAGRDWERQQQAQGGFVDPAIRSAQSWERQRAQQNGANR